MLPKRELIVEVMNLSLILKDVSKEFKTKYKKTTTLENFNLEIQNTLDIYNLYNLTCKIIYF